MNEQIYMKSKIKSIFCIEFYFNEHFGIYDLYYHFKWQKRRFMKKYGDLIISEEEYIKALNEYMNKMKEKQAKCDHPAFGYVIEMPYKCIYYCQECGKEVDIQQMQAKCQHDIATHTSYEDAFCYKCGKEFEKQSKEWYLTLSTHRLSLIQLHDALKQIE